MKKILALLFVFVLLAVAVTPAVAATPAVKVKPPNPHAAFVVAGKITAVDPTAKTVTLNVTHENQIARWLLGSSKTVTLTLTAQTRLSMWTKAGTKRVTFADLKVGQRVMAQGRVAKGVWMAQHVLIELGLAR